MFDCCKNTFKAIKQCKITSNIYSFLRHENHIYNNPTSVKKIIIYNYIET